MRARRISPAFAPRSSGAGSMAASGENKSYNKTHSVSQRPQTHMHPLGLLLNITCCTILATHLFTETFRSLRTNGRCCWMRDARRQDAVHQAALDGMWRDDPGRLGFWAHGRAEHTLSAAEFIGPRPPQKPESLEYAAVLGGVK
jgi:hypothetical protein